MMLLMYLPLRFAFTAWFLSAATLLAAPGDLFVTGSIGSINGTTIYKLGANGGASPVLSGLTGGTGFAVDAVGNFYLAELSTGTIRKTTPQGVTTTFATGLDAPRGMEFDAFGNLYVATRGNVTKITSDGTISIFNTTPDTNLWDVTFDRNGNLYTSDYGLRSIYKITPQGVRSTVTRISGDGPFHHLEATASGDLIVTQGPHHRVYRVSPTGTLSVFATDDDNDGTTFYQPIGVESNAAGEIFIGDYDKIYRYAADGTPLGVFASGIANSGHIAMQAIPEPATFGLLMLSSGLGALRWRKRPQHA